MENMKRNTLSVPLFVALFLFALSFVAAGELAVAGSVETRFNDIVLSSAPSTTFVAGMAGEVVPVRVTFTADTDMADVRVKVSMEGFRDDVSASTSRFDIVDNTKYTKLLSLQIPTDADELTEEFTLYVEIVSGSDQTEVLYTIRIQRESYTLNILSVDYASKVSAGDVFPVTVVAKNTGFNDLDDSYVVVSIPALGISSRGYMGDIVAQEDDDNGEDDTDASERTVYLKIPSNAPEGVYDLEVEVYNDDASATTRKLISVSSVNAATLLATVKNKDVRAGESVTYEMVILNTGDDVKVFNIQTVSGDFLDVSAPTAVVIGPDSSQTITVTAKVANDARPGIYTFTVDVNGEQTVFGANVVGRGSGAAGVSLVAWTVILVIVFVVLLAVLLVLVTRREKPVEEVETSYY